MDLGQRGSTDKQTTLSTQVTHLQPVLLTWQMDWQHALQRSVEIFKSSGRNSQISGLDLDQ